MLSMKFLYQFPLPKTLLFFCGGGGRGVRGEEGDGVGWGRKGTDAT